MTTRTTDKRPSIPPIIGKRAIMRNGEKTGIIQQADNFCPLDTYMDKLGSWQENGQFMGGMYRKWDIVAVCKK